MSFYYFFLFFFFIFFFFLNVRVIFTYSSVCPSTMEKIQPRHKASDYFVLNFGLNNCAFFKSVDLSAMPRYLFLQWVQKKTCLFALRQSSEEEAY